MVGTLRGQDGMAWQVLRRGVAVLRLLYQSDRESKVNGIDKPNKEALRLLRQQQRKQLRDKRVGQLVARLREKGHKPHIRGNRLSCVKCKSKGKLAQVGSTWGKQLCRGGSRYTKLAEGVHATHRVSAFRGVVFCRVRGAWAVKRLVKLKLA